MEYMKALQKLERMGHSGEIESVRSQIVTSRKIS